MFQSVIVVFIRCRSLVDLKRTKLFILVIIRSKALVAIKELLFIKNASTHIAMDFS